MAQLRQDYHAFVDRGAEVVVVGPEDREAFARYWSQHDLPFVGLADPNHDVAKAYGQRVRLLKLGRMPALVVVDRAGTIRYRHYGESMRDIASSDDVLAVLDRLNVETDTASGRGQQEETLDREPDAA